MKAGAISDTLWCMVSAAHSGILVTPIRGRRSETPLGHRAIENGGVGKPWLLR
jgi:hypothetical protein